MAARLAYVDNDIAYISGVLLLTPDSDPNRPLLLARLGRYHLERFDLLAQPNDPPKAVEYTTSALALTDDDDPRMPGLLGTLGMAYAARFKCSGAVDDIDKAIDHSSISLAITPDGHPSLPDRLGHLGMEYHDRFERQGQLQDLDTAIDYDSRALALTPDGDKDLPYRLSSLGTSHGVRFERLGELDDLENEIKYISLSVALTPDTYPQLLTRLGNLATAHQHRYERLEQLDDLEKALRHRSRLIALAPAGHPDMSKWLTFQGIAHARRFEQLGDLDDIDKAINYQSRAIALTPDGHKDLPDRVSSLGASHGVRFQRLGELHDIENMVKYISRSVALTPDVHPELSDRLGDLATAHQLRYERLEQLDDLKKSLEYRSRLIATNPDGHPDMSTWLSSQGAVHTRRFERLGELDDIDKAIEYGSRALALSPNGHPHLSAWASNLGESHKLRFRRLGELADIERAIEFQNRALDLTADGDPGMPSRLANLGISHYFRFERLNRLEDVEKAIECQSRGIGLTPAGHPMLPGRLSGLAASHRSRFIHLSEPNDLDKAIEYESRALSLIPEGHHNLRGHLNNLGSSYDHRYRYLGDLGDFNKSVEYKSRALALTPEGHPDLTARHYGIAILHIARFYRDGDSSCLETALEFFRKATQSKTGNPRGMFFSASTWARHASENSSLRPLEAYQTTIDLLPQFIWLGATSNQRYQDLLAAQRLAVDAAYEALRYDENGLALEWLEHARCVVWNQSTMLRSPLDQLDCSHPELATHFKSVANRLHSASSDSREFLALISSSDSTTLEQAAQDHHRLAKEYNETLAHIRSLPGYEDLLRPMKVDDLMRAARNGPIVVINCQENRCDALVVFPEQDQPERIPLLNFTGAKAQKMRWEIQRSLSRKGVRQRGCKARRGSERKDEFGPALATLWYELVKPILELLGCLNDVSEDKMPHITWCPTGALSFLPLHAAGDYDQPRSKVFDYIISSYTPTLSALLASTPSTISPDSGVVAIGMEQTPGQTWLPGTTGELERVRGHLDDITKYVELVNTQATRTATLDAMERHHWVHLACHAHQNVEDPTKSGFFLHDGTLDLATINRRTFQNKGVAFLSACQTATGDEKLPDEAVHLASGMLMAGYTSVIGTMWSVHDDDAPLIADKVYEQLMRERKIGNGEAGKALHYAVAELRRKVGEKEFGRWVPYIHIGS